MKENENQTIIAFQLFRVSSKKTSSFSLKKNFFCDTYHSLLNSQKNLEIRLDGS